MLTLESQPKATNVVTLGRTTLLFSYAALVAFEDDDGKLVNPTYVGHSTTTTAAMNRNGFKGAQVAETEGHFTRALASSLGKAL